MSQYTQYIVLYNDGKAQHYVGTPQKTYDKAMTELTRLAFDEDYDVPDLSIVRAPI